MRLILAAAKIGLGGSIAENDHRKTARPTTMGRFSVSVRGLSFLHQWMDDNLPLHSSSDAILARALAQRAAKAAKEAGIPPEEISEEVGSMFTTMLEALGSREHGLS